MRKKIIKMTRHLVGIVVLIAIGLYITGCSATQSAQSLSTLQVKKVAKVLIPNPGIDELGANKYRKEAIKAHPRGWAGGIFLRTFGDAKKTVEEMACSNKYSELVVHLAPFDRTHTYPISSLKKQVIADSKWLQKVALKCPQTTLMPSPFCEHNHSAGKIKPILDQIRKVAPNTIPVNSIWKGGIVYGYTTEIHLENSKPRAPPTGDYTVSFDGFGGDGRGDFTDTDLEKIFRRYSGARHIRAWNFRFNGKFGHKDTTPINARKAWPSVEYIKGHAAMMKLREGAVTWAKGLYKPFADDHGQGGKDNKAMVILPINKNSIKVFDSAGNHIDTMKRVLPDHTGEPKGARFYSTKYAYQIADLAEKNTGSRLIRIENMPLTDGDLRSRLFR